MQCNACSPVVDEKTWDFIVFSSLALTATPVIMGASFGEIIFPVHPAAVSDTEPVTTMPVVGSYSGTECELDVPRTIAAKLEDGVGGFRFFGPTLRAQYSPYCSIFQSTSGCHGS